MSGWGRSIWCRGLESRGGGGGLESVRSGREKTMIYGFVDSVGGTVFERMYQLLVEVDAKTFGG